MHPANRHRVEFLTSVISGRCLAAEVCSGAAGISTLLRRFVGGSSSLMASLGGGTIIYGSARKSYLRILDPVQNQALRLCLGAFHTSPVSSLHVEANEIPLDVR